MSSRSSRAPLAALTLAGVLAGLPARAAEPGATGDAAGTGTRSDEQPARPEKPELSPRRPDLDFDLLGAPKEKPDPALQRKIALRRKMLTWHPAVGAATWATLAATTIVGQLDFNDRFRGGGDTGKYHSWHRGLAYGTSALFVGTALLGVLAPKPYPKPVRLDTALLHKILMGATAAGLVTQIVLGTVARGKAGSVEERDLAAAHQVVGYATLGTMSAGMVVLLF